MAMNCVFKPITLKTVEGFACTVCKRFSRTNDERTCIDKEKLKAAVKRRGCGCSKNKG